MELIIARREDEAGNGTLTLTGSIDLVTRQAVLDAGMEVLTHGGALTLDLGGVDFIDSTGIGALIELTRAASSAGSRLVVFARSERVARVFEATGLEDAWERA